MHTLFYCHWDEDIWKTCYYWVDLKVAFSTSINMHYSQHVFMLENKEKQARWRLVQCSIAWSYGTIEIAFFSMVMYFKKKSYGRGSLLLLVMAKEF